MGRKRSGGRANTIDRRRDGRSQDNGYEMNMNVTGIRSNTWGVTHVQPMVGCLIQSPIPSDVIRNCVFAFFRCE
jgi:hypothetical protein